MALFQDFEAQEAVVKTARYYESEDLWILNVSAGGETYILRPTSVQLPLKSTSDEILKYVSDTLQQTTKRVATANPLIKALVSAVEDKQYRDTKPTVAGLSIGLASLTTLPVDVWTEYRIYNGYVSSKEYGLGYVDLSKYELIASHSIQDLSTDKNNPTTVTWTPSKAFVEGSVVAITTYGINPKDSQPEEAMLGIVKLGYNKSSNLAPAATDDGNKNIEFDAELGILAINVISAVAKGTPTVDGKQGSDVALEKRAI